MPSRFVAGPGEIHSVDCARMLYIYAPEREHLGVLERREGAPPCDCHEAQK